MAILSMGHPPSPLSRPHSGDSSSSKGRDSQPRSSSKANKAGSHHAAGQNGHRETSAAAQKAAVTCRTTSDGSEDKENGLIGMPSNASTPRKRPRASDMRLDTRASLSPQTERINAVEKALLDHADKPPAKKRRKVTVHVEVALRPASHNRRPRFDSIRMAVVEFIHESFDSLFTECEIEDQDEWPLLMKEYIDRIRIAEASIPAEVVILEDAKLKIHIYCPSRAFVIDSFTAAPPGQDLEGGEPGEDSDVMAATVAQLPSLALEGIWDNLVYDGDVKARLLNYINSTQVFSDKRVDFNIITWNRVVLLHGPPGTGKTSLCRALAQKLAIRMTDRYTHGKLVEINSHSIMSKWFSESGKLVQRLFTHVLELVEDESCFVVVLIDEVESLTSARAGAMSGKEPSDAVRVVNALLTQLDKLKNKKNVLVMTTSNLSGAIDSAFIDRADIKQYIGLPPVQAVYWILLGCIRELMRSGVITQSLLLDWKPLQSQLSGFGTEDARDGLAKQNSQQLLRLAEICHGLSGRTLRRIPLLTHARYFANGQGLLQTNSHFHADFNGDGAHPETDLMDDNDSDDGRGDDVSAWLQAMLIIAKQEKEQLEKIEQNQIVQ